MMFIESFDKHYDAADGLAAADKDIAGGAARGRAEVSERLESVKHRLWHGNTEEALDRLGEIVNGVGSIRPGQLCEEGR